MIIIGTKEPCVKINLGYFGLSKQYIFSMNYPHLAILCPIRHSVILHYFGDPATHPRGLVEKVH
jgi:hypothetical protein